MVSHPDRVIVGVINWFAVHATSMNNSNSYISGDNKGAASLALEKMFNKGYAAGKVSCGFQI
jgi:neutral ceramidase